MFERLQHRRVAVALEALNADMLRSHRCYFGGGSAIDYLADNPKRLGECMAALQMFDTPEAVLWQHITGLGR